MMIVRASRGIAAALFALALLARGDNEVGPYQSPMEDGMQHFHEWYREKLRPVQVG